MGMLEPLLQSRSSCILQHQLQQTPSLSTRLSPQACLGGKGQVCFVLIFVLKVSKKRDEIHREGIAVDEAKLRLQDLQEGSSKDVSTDSQTS